MKENQFEIDTAEAGNLSPKRKKEHPRLAISSCLVVKEDDPPKEDISPSIPRKEVLSSSQISDFSVDSDENIEIKEEDATIAQE